MRADVDSLMQGELGQWLAGQSEMREAARQKAHWRWTWGAAIMLPVLALVWFGIDASAGLRAIVTLFGATVFGIWGYQPIDEAKKTIKVGINSAIARALGIEYSAEIEPGEEFAAAGQYRLLPRYNRSNFEDHWHGTLEGHPFSLYEAHLEERRGSGKKPPLGNGVSRRNNHHGVWPPVSFHHCAATRGQTAFMVWPWRPERKR